MWSIRVILNNLFFIKLTTKVKKKKLFEKFKYFLADMLHVFTILLVRLYFWWFVYLRNSEILDIELNFEKKGRYHINMQIWLLENVLIL
jgi:hypothetical protein